MTSTIFSSLFSPSARPVETSALTAKQVQEIAKKVAFIAITAFAWTINSSLFLLGFTTGIAWSLIAPAQSTSDCHHGGGCSDGVLENLSGIHIPPSVQLAAGTAILWAHLDHHPACFVPLVGFYAGTLASRTVSLLT